jgi:hypothetical protein
MCFDFKFNSPKFSGQMFKGPAEDMGLIKKLK